MRWNAYKLAALLFGALCWIALVELALHMA
jgi:hypothetical protein